MAAARDAQRSFSALEKALGHRFEQPELLHQALTHSSTSRGRAERVMSNERLEFLGDRVLGLAVAEILMERFPADEEGALARRHAALVRREALARVAESIGLGALIHMARGEHEAGGRTNPTLLADACEAVIAALYMDGGLAVAAGFIRRWWTPLVGELAAAPKDNKTALQEWAQGRGRPVPAYTEVSREGPPHAPVFTVEVTLEGESPARATGPSKRAAEQAAAGALLERLGERP